MYTWFNRRENGMIRERLDRAMVNLQWEEEYPSTQVLNLPTVGSDHSPIFL